MVVRRSTPLCREAVRSAAESLLSTDMKHGERVLRSVPLGDGERVKCILYTCEDLGSDPQQPGKKPSVVSCAWNPRDCKTGGRDRDPRKTIGKPAWHRSDPMRELS